MPLSTTFAAKKVSIPVEQVELSGDLTYPDPCRGLVIFSHGSGSGRFSPRNRMVAARLNEEGFATLLFDLLTEEEDKVYENRFNIGLLTNRLIMVTEWASIQYIGLSIGYFGASTGAASALRSAATLGKMIAAVVSRGGRPDLAMEMLNDVEAATLLIVGGDDTVVLDLNEKAYEKLKCTKWLEVIPEATHLFEEEGKLEQVAELAASWFRKYMSQDKSPE